MAKVAKHQSEKTCRSNQRQTTSNPMAAQAYSKEWIRCASPVPTITAVGVARPKAQGHAITSTAMPNISANRKQSWPLGSQSSGYHPSTPAKYLQVISAALLVTGWRELQQQSSFYHFGRRESKAGLLQHQASRNPGQESASCQARAIACSQSSHAM